MIKSQFKLSAIAFGITLTTSSIVVASPWVDTQDPYLKASITALANAGIIKAPVNTYPLMWKSIASDLTKAHNGKVPQHLQYALKHIKHALKHSQNQRTTGVKVKTASKNRDFQSFGERHNAKGELNFYNEFIGDQWAFKSSVHFYTDADNNKKRSYEGSYLSGTVGNWVVSVDQVSQWWGPGNDSVMALSNNAVAFPAVRFTRHHSAPIDLPVLNWLGPISMTTYFGMQEHSNTIQNIRTWGARVNFRPIDALEIGFTRTAQWGGTNRPTRFSNFVDLLAGTDNAGIGGEVSSAQEPGNQLAGVDLHWSQSLLGQQFGFYAEFIGEDESGGLPSHLMYQLGMETSFGDRNSLYHLFAEVSDTYIDCSAGGNGIAGNCAYEHHIYEEGYRRYHRSMGSTYDSDANIFTVGLSQAKIGGSSWFGKFKYMKLNKNGTNFRGTINPASAVAQDRLQLEGGYRFPVLKGLLNIEAMLYRSEMVATGAIDTKGSLKASWEYRF
jgi:hypothetical protein